MRYRHSIIAVAAFAALSCIEFKDDDASKKRAAAAASTAQVADSSDISFPSYEAFALDTAGVGQRYASTPADDSLYSQITPKSVGTPITRFPARLPKRGAGALQIQVLLDRAHFSPGIIDGVWGDNAVKALAFFKNPDAGDSAGSSATDTSMAIDQQTYTRLRSAAGTDQVVTKYTLTQEDVAGPFTDVPDNVYEQAKLDCLCYSSAAEGVAEKFHTSQKLLAQLNPGVALGSLKAGTVLTVPNVEAATLSKAGDSATVSSASASASGGVAQLVISKKGFWTHAVDASGKIIAHYPSTLGSGYLSSADESPTGGYKITNIAWEPAFHYQPTLFAEVSDKKPEAHLPKGPNSPVGVVWMALSKPHFGIHGTSAPETIGYSNSHGCVRLTNWDAIELGRLVAKGTPVVFR
jgi:lipoprotein-anchoring transpeptidase ErfK/SrfK